MNLEFKSEVVKDAGIFHCAVASGPPSPTDAKVMGWSGNGDIGIGPVTLAPSSGSKAFVCTHSIFSVLAP